MICVSRDLRRLHQRLSLVVIRGNAASISTWVQTWFDSVTPIPRVNPSTRTSITALSLFCLSLALPGFAPTSNYQARQLTQALFYKWNIKLSFFNCDEKWQTASDYWRIKQNKKGKSWKTTKQAGNTRFFERCKFYFVYMLENQPTG